MADIFGDQAQYSEYSHWAKFQPPWYNPYRNARLAGQVTGGAATFAQVQLFNANDWRVALVMNYGIVQPANSFVFVTSSVVFSGVPLAAARPVVNVETIPGVVMFSATPGSLPAADYVIGTGGAGVNTWGQPYPFAVLQPGQGIYFTCPTVNVAMFVAAYVSMVQPDELPMRFR
jgi:hypothetical protein